MESLEHLKKLVLDNDWDSESHQQVRDLEKRLHRLTVTEKLASHTVMAEYMDYLRSEIARSKETLSEDDTLTEPQRNKLFERIKQSREFLGRFDPKAREELEKTINDLLNVARHK